MAVESLFNSLPAHWEVTTLGKVCERTGGDIQTGPFGSQLHASDYVPFGIPSIMPKNIGDNRVVTEGIARITTQDAERLSRYLVRTGDIVYSRRGDVERRALIRAEEDGWLCGTGCLRVRFGNGEIDPLYASYYLSHPTVREWIVRHAIGATMPNLNTSILSALPFVVPPPSEQKAIANILGTLDDKIELNQQMNGTLEAIARAIFKSWFVDFDPVRAKMDGKQPVGMDAATAELFPDEFEDSALEKIPKGWRVGRLRDCCKRVENGGTPKRSEPKYWEPGTIPWLTSGEVRQKIVTATENFISTEGFVNSSAKLWSSGTTVVALYGATAGQVCFLAQEMCTNQACCGLVPTENMQFFIYLLASSSVKTLERQARGSAQQNLSQQIIADFTTIIPENTVLKQFDKSVQSLFDKWIANLHESKTLATIRDTLLPKLLSGEIRIKEAEKIVEEVS